MADSIKDLREARVLLRQCEAIFRAHPMWARFTDSGAVHGRIETFLERTAALDKCPLCEEGYGVKFDDDNAPYHAALGLTWPCANSAMRRGRGR